MSKKLIAGAGVVASFAIALAPLATFAADADWNSDQHTDTWNVTVLPTCAFGAASATPVRGVDHNAASATPHDNSTNAATWAATNNNDGSGTGDEVYSNNLGTTPDMKATTGEGAITPTQYNSVSTATYSIYAGTADTNMGTTTLKVVCNQNNGYKIKVVANNLTLSGADPIQAIASPDAVTTGYKIATSTEVSGATTADVTAYSASGTAAVTKGTASAATGDAYTFTYGIGIAPGTTAGTYTGDVVYTLVQQLGA